MICAVNDLHRESFTLYKPILKVTNIATAQMDGASEASLPMESF